MKGNRRGLHLLVLALLLALALSACVRDSHACDDPCCILCRFAELRRQFLPLSLVAACAAAFGACRLAQRALCDLWKRPAHTLVSFCVQLND